MKMKRADKTLRTLTLLFVGLFTQILMAETTLERIYSTKTIKLGYRENSVPFSYASKDGVPMGFSVELCRKISTEVRNHLKLQQLEEKWVLLNAGERLQAVKDGVVDIECGNTTNTPERRKTVAFAIPTFIASVVVMSHKAKPVNDYQGMSGKKVTAIRNGTVVNIIRERNRVYAAGIELIEAKDTSEAVQLLEDRKVDAWATDDAVLYGLRPTMKDPSVWEISSKRLSVEPIALAFRLNDTAFEDLVNKQIRNMMQSELFHAEYKRWFLQPIPDRKVTLNLPMSSLLVSFISHPTSQMPPNY
jgi:ABC-type amino acid transport substrate-binding protein